MLQPPVGHGEGGGGVDDDHDHRDGGETPVVFGAQHAGRQHQLNPGRDQVEGQDAQQEVHRARSPVHRPRQGARAFGLVEIQRQAQRMGEGLGRRRALGGGAHRREHHVGDQGRGRRQEPNKRPADGEGRKAQADGGRRTLPRRQTVDRRAQHQRRQNAQPLARQRQQDGRDQPQFQMRRTGPSHQPRKIRQRRQRWGTVRLVLWAPCLLRLDHRVTPAAGAFASHRHDAHMESQCDRGKATLARERGFVAQPRPATASINSSTAASCVAHEQTKRTEPSSKA